MNATTTRRLQAPEIVLAPAFAAFGALVGGRLGASLVAAGAGAVAGLLFAFLGANLLVLALSLANPHLGRDAVRAATAGGLLLILPFALLALAAEGLLGWNASSVFASAGLMTASAATGLEVVRRGGGRLRSTLVPSVTAFVLSAAWVGLSTFVAANWKG